LHENYSFAQKFIVNGFPLVLCGNTQYSQKNAKKYVNITKASIDDIKDWYLRLSNIDKQKIQIPLARLNYAIHERDSVEDSIIDAITAWEGMFGGAPETTFKVVGSIAKFLKNINERKEFLKTLKEIYDLRSDIVHGKNKNSMNDENKERLRSEGIKIGLDCLKKLMIDQELLALPPAERVNKILVLA
jgi:hypothetical protein